MSLAKGQPASEGMMTGAHMPMDLPRLTRAEEPQPPPGPTPGLVYDRLTLARLSKVIAGQSASAYLLQPPDQEPAMRPVPVYLLHAAHVEDCRGPH
jgi:hypothetical protein